MLYKDRLKRLREEKELTQAFLAELLNMHEFVYGQYEREYTIMPIRHLNTLSNYFNVSVDYLFSFSLEKNYGNIRSSIDLNIVALRLKEFRKENKLTQESLAQLLNVVKGTVGNYESGRALIATPFLYEICKKYNISADYLLGKIDEPKFLK